MLFYVMYILQLHMYVICREIRIVQYMVNAGIPSYRINVKIHITTSVRVRIWTDKEHMYSYLLYPIIYFMEVTMNSYFLNNLIMHVTLLCRMVISFWYIHTYIGISYYLSFLNGVYKLNRVKPHLPATLLIRPYCNSGCVK